MTKLTPHTSHLRGLISHFRRRLSSLQCRYLPGIPGALQDLSGLYRIVSAQSYSRRAQNTAKYRMIARLIAMLENYQEPACEYKIAFGPL